MIRRRVRSLRARPFRALLTVAAGTAAAALVTAPGAAAATGGTGAAGPLVAATAPTTATLPSAPGESTSAATGPQPSPIAAAPGAGQAASPADADPLMPRMPVLATAARQADDPAPVDVGTLGTPTNVAAIDGHVVVVRERMSHSELVDFADPERPRILLASTRPFGTPHAGRDEQGRAVVVASPCAGTPAVVDQGEAPRCPLRVIDLATGASRPVPGSTGALAGDVAGTRVVLSRLSPSAGVKLYVSSGESAAAPIALPVLGAGDGEEQPTRAGLPAAGSTRAPQFDIDAAGRIAVVLEYAAISPRFSSGLWLRSSAGSWRRLTTVGTTFRGLGTRHVLGPTLDPVATSAYVEGVVETPSFVGRWADDGDQTLRRSIRRSIGRSTILLSAAFDRDRMVFVDWLPGAPCGVELEVACGLRSLSPVRTAPLAAPARVTAPAP